MAEPSQYPEPPDQSGEGRVPAAEMPDEADPGDVLEQAQEAHDPDDDTVVDATMSDDPARTGTPQPDR